MGLIIRHVGQPEGRHNECRVLAAHYPHIYWANMGFSPIFLRRPPSQFRALTPLRAITLRAALRRSFLINISTYLSSRARADGKSICIHTSPQFHRPAVLQSMLHTHILLTESFAEKRGASHCGWTVGRTGSGWKKHSRTSG